jgi:hypothetical protein
VNLRWRDLDGRVRSRSQTFRPGIHTVVLGNEVAR